MARTPYTNFHDLNLNWIIEKIKTVFTPDNPPPYPVTSVNQKTGDVDLKGTDIKVSANDPRTISDALTSKYEKPASGIPASDLAPGVIPNPASVIDDSAGAQVYNKTWSAHKLFQQEADIVDLQNDKQDTPASAGTAGQVLGLNSDLEPEWVDMPEAQLIDAVDDWLSENITNPSNPPLDRSLSLANACAPADMVGDIKNDFSDYIDTVPIKNKINITKANSTNNGITFTNNNNGTISCSGTSTNRIYLKFGECFLYANRHYILSGMINPSCVLQVLDVTNSTLYASEQNNTETDFTVPTDGKYNIRFYCGNGVNIDEIVSPMIRESFYISNVFAKRERPADGVAVWIGDSFVQANSLASAGLDQTKRFATLVSKKLNLVEKNYAVGGMGYITGNTPFITQLQNAIADNSFDHDSVTHIFISGGINDLNTADLETLLYPAVKNVVDTASTSFPNAQIYIIPLTYYDKNISQIGFWVYKTIAGICKEGKANLIPNAYTWLNGMLDDILSDGTHPNIEGHALIASYVLNSLLSGNIFTYPASCAYSPYSAKIDTDTQYYFCSMKHNGKITINGSFKLNARTTQNERIYQYENSTSKNNLTYIGRYGKNVPCFNIGTGAMGVLLVSQEETENGYINYVNSVTPLDSGTWKVLSTDLNIGLQEYSGNKT